MIRRIPIVPTLLVLIAVGYMIHLGFWQLDRLHQKEFMLRVFHSNDSDRSVHRWADGDLAAIAYARVSGECANVISISPQAGRNVSGQTGWIQVASCEMRKGYPAQIVMGWTTRPAPVKWAGGEVTGTYVPGKGSVIVADPPLAGLQPNAKPDPRDIPNNHLAYAVQWFLFAGVALIIYTIALRKRLRAG